MSADGNSSNNNPHLAALHLMKQQLERHGSGRSYGSIGNESTSSIGNLGITDPSCTPLEFIGDSLGSNHAILSIGSFLDDAFSTQERLGSLEPATHPQALLSKTSKRSFDATMKSLDDIMKSGNFTSFNSDDDLPVNQALSRIESPSDVFCNETNDSTCNSSALNKLGLDGLTKCNASAFQRMLDTADEPWLKEEPPLTQRDPLTNEAPKKQGSKTKRNTTKRRNLPKRKQGNVAVKDYIEGDFTDKDVLMGRGGRTNHHPGNRAYLAEKERMQERYFAATKSDKTGITQELVTWVHARGGRFLERDDDDRWYEADAKTAHKKASQTLREKNTPESRAHKRAKYNGKNKNEYD